MPHFANNVCSKTCRVVLWCFGRMSLCRRLELIQDKTRLGYRVSLVKKKEKKRHPSFKSSSWRFIWVAHVRSARDSNPESLAPEADVLAIGPTDLCACSEGNSDQPFSSLFNNVAQWDVVCSALPLLNLLLFSSSR